MTYMTRPATVPVKVCSVAIFQDSDNVWHCIIDVPNERGPEWTMRDGHRPGALLNAALKWANDRGLDIGFINADITRQEANETTDIHGQHRH